MCENNACRGTLLGTGDANACHVCLILMDSGRRAVVKPPPPRRPSVDQRIGPDPEKTGLIMALGLGTKKPLTRRAKENFVHWKVLH